MKKLESPKRTKQPTAKKPSKPHPAPWEPKTVTVTVIDDPENTRLFFARLRERILKRKQQ